MNDDRRNGISGNDWNDDTVDIVEKLSHCELIEQFMRAVRYTAFEGYSADRPLYKQSMMREELLRRMRCCQPSEPGDEKDYPGE